MPNKRISELELLTNPSISDALPIVSNGSTKKIAVGSLLQSGLPVSASSITATSIHVEGDITADSFTIVSTSVQYATGSTIFGNSDDDFHNFTGSVFISGNMGVIGNTNVTGSITVSGSTVQIGNTRLNGTTTLTGSFISSGSSSFLGNHILSGTNTIIGNTIMSGSIEVSGSSNFHNSLFIITGSSYISGAMELTGSLKVFGNVDVVSGSAFYLWGNKLFNYGAFYDTTTQSGSANVSQSIQFNSIDYSQGVSVTNKTRIVLANVGIYNIQFSAQLVDSGAGDSIIHIWIKKNGVNVPNSSGRIFLQANKETIASWNYVVPATSPNDYYELVWQSTDADARILYEAATGNIPAIPSIILTVTQVA
jgi:hypothetical protein